MMIEYDSWLIHGLIDRLYWPKHPCTCKQYSYLHAPFSKINPEYSWIYQIVLTTNVYMVSKCIMGWSNPMISFGFYTFKTTQLFINFSMTKLWPGLEPWKKFQQPCIDMILLYVFFCGERMMIHSRYCSWKKSCTSWDVKTFLYIMG